MAALESTGRLHNCLPCERNKSVVIARRQIILLINRFFGQSGFGWRMTFATSEFGPSRQAAFFGPTVANGALRTWLDLQLAPPSRE